MGIFVLYLVSLAFYAFAITPVDASALTAVEAFARVAAEEGYLVAIGISLMVFGFVPIGITSFVWAFFEVLHWVSIGCPVEKGDTVEEIMFFYQVKLPVMKMELAGQDREIERLEHKLQCTQLRYEISKLMHKRDNSVERIYAQLYASRA
jgi:hypothetical protein